MSRLANHRRLTQPSLYAIELALKYLLRFILICLPLSFSLVNLGTGFSDDWQCPLGSEDCSVLEICMTA
ncbi:uncharacterized protein ARMOST_17770 [Armillaria ostoyae]|uniref:Uncharacterized protein n=1 Tax=Armillaria ostoyae TaxID=47428 RepID=A0A284RZY9_ARMOS|nr:uncharacterized protein ARMOST_17770 [Armillaria ostoyae]